MKMILFAGAGCSAELGVPTMRQMVAELLTHLHTVARDTRFLDQLTLRLDATQGDLESVIEDIDRLCAIEDVLPSFGGAVDAALLESARVTRSEIEWFVQHVCERIRTESAAALWAPMVRASAGIDLTIATTNYDRAVEHACQSLDRDVVDGFGSFDDREWAVWKGFEGSGVRLMKLHGSTDWYRVRNGSDVYKLRHPMPLFGGVTLELDHSGLQGLGSALVMPSREKRKNEPPFPLISYEFLTAAKSADIAVFVGTSLRDPDLRSLADDCARRILTIVVGPTFALNDGVVPAGAAIVNDYASAFLISVLPGMVSSGRFPDRASITPPSSGGPLPVSILEDVRTASDPDVADDLRCAAVENLWRCGTSLGSSEIAPLVARGAGPVARDALALVALSRDIGELLRMCKESAATSTDPSFCADFELLEQMTTSPNVT